jgi:thioester reductase-like protein
MNILLTGATGDLGAAYLNYLNKIDLKQEYQFYCLVRADNDQLARERLKCADENDLHSRIVVVRGDISSKNLGMNEILYQQLTKKINIIIHCAADVRFNQKRESIFSTNYDGTKNILELARQCTVAEQFQYLLYFSTAYTAGKTYGVISPDERSERMFNNTYEESKYFSELLVCSYCSENKIPYIIYKPSIIIGSSETGYISERSILYHFIMLYQQLFHGTILPVRKKGKLDLVAMNYVVKASWELAVNGNCFGQCFHLTCGKEQTVPSSTFTRIIVEELGLDGVKFVAEDVWEQEVLPNAKINDSELYKKLSQLRLASKISGYNSYFNSENPIFDNTDTERILVTRNIVAEDPESVLRKCIRYAKLNYLCHNGT